MYILDTDVVSNVRKQKPHPGLLRWIGKTGWSELATTAFTIMEIQMGIERARQSDNAIASRVETWLAGLLQAGQPQILLFGAAAAQLLGRMNETPALHPPDAKKTKTGADIAIASMAIAQRAAVATANSDDFVLIHEHFPLPGLYNPFLDQWIVEPPKT